MCQEFHEYCHFERSLNATFVSLIPKKHGADEIKNFRPISLVGGMYKSIAKLWEIRLSVVLGKIISPSQMKKRSPLRFFPNLEPLSEKREFGTGLTIMVNAAGQRFVLRHSNDNISVTKQGVPRTKDFQDAQHRGGLPNQSRRWVPRQRVLTKDKQGVGFTSEPKGQ
jgi:hypothetical protein